MDKIEEKAGIDPDVIVLKFADSKIPCFKEARNKDYIKYGENNNYPEYLTYLFDKSSKHNAILTGKADYIYGNGYENGDQIINRLGESLNDLSKKSILDIEVYGGFRWEVIWSRGGKVAEIYHVDYSCIRVGKDGGFYYKESWDINNRDKEEYMPAFNPSNPVGSQIFSYSQYRPKVRYYPLPSYIGCNNYVETDIEISKFYLSSIRNGMMPSKMLQFYMGDPGEEKKKELEARFKKKFAGSENAGKFIMVFNPGGKDKSIDVADLSGTELDKMFVELNKTCQQEIFSGHKVTSPMLFGIKTEGQLGGATELKTAYEIFVNTYAKPKANAFDKEVNYVLGYSFFPGKYELRQNDPVGWQIPDSVLAQAITPDEVREKLGFEVKEKPVASQAAQTLSALAGVSPLVATKILDNLTKNEIRSLAALPPLADGNLVPGTEGAGSVAVNEPSTSLDSDIPAANDNIKNLTGKQHQQLIRIIRQYSKGQLTEVAAKALLRAGLGLTEDDMNSLLGIEPVETPTATAMSAEFNQDEDSIISVFDEFGDSKNDYDIIKSKKVCFSLDEINDDESEYIKSAFANSNITSTENKIIELIRKDKRITPDVIATTIGETKRFVESKIAGLIKRGYIETATETIGTDTIIERIIPNIDIVPPASKAKINPTQIYVKYSYEVKPGIGPAIIKTTRPFCRKLIQLNRLYSRADIEKISQRLGYSVFDRKGGWWGGSPECRHRWVSHIVVKKEDKS